MPPENRQHRIHKVPRQISLRYQNGVNHLIRSPRQVVGEVRQFPYEGVRVAAAYAQSTDVQTTLRCVVCGAKTFGAFAAHSLDAEMQALLGRGAHDPRGPVR